MERIFLKEHGLFECFEDIEQCSAVHHAEVLCVNDALAIFNELLGSVRGLSAVPMPLYLVLYRAIENGLPGMPDGDDIRMKNSLE